MESMKVIFLAAGSDGDINPHLGLGCELKARGHEVLFLTTFDYVESVRACSLESLSVIGPEEADEFKRAGSLGSVAKIKARCRFFSRKTCEICDLVAGRLDGRTILVAPPFGYAVAKLLHQRYRTPYVSTVLAPANLCSLRNPPAFKSGEWFARMPYPARKLLFHCAERLVVDPVVRMLLKHAARKLDLPLPRRVMSEWCYSPHSIVGLFADWFCPKAEDWPEQLVLTGFPLFDPKGETRQLSAGLRQFLDAGSPPVVFTAGTETPKSRVFFEAMVRTATGLGVRGIVLTRLADQLPQLPKTIWHESYTCLDLLLPRARALVHHGGIGTTAQAMRAGVPQLILPGRLDQFDNAQHVRRLGCGLVQRHPWDSSAVMEKLQYLITATEVQTACRWAQSRLEPSAEARSRAADIVEQTFRAAIPF
jgi:rhamnosyltransferase subunit B